MKPFKYCPHCGEKLIEDSTNEKELEELDKQVYDREKVKEPVQVPYTPYDEPKPWTPPFSFTREDIERDRYK